MNLIAEFYLVCIIISFMIDTSKITIASEICLNIVTIYEEMCRKVIASYGAEVFDIATHAG